MINKGLFNSSIHLRFLAVALLPLLLITFVLNYYTIDARKKDLTKNLNSTGEIASDYLATISDFALYSRNLPLLKTTAQSVIRLPDVTGVAYLDKSKKLVINSGDFPKTALPSFTPEVQPDQQIDTSKTTNLFLYFKKPIYLSGIDFTDYQEEAPELAPDSELIGWVIVAIDQSSLLKKQREIITTSLWLAAAGFIIATILTYLLSLMLIKPIHRLTATIKKMASGDLNTRAVTGTQDELAILANGINQLAKSVLEGRMNLEDRIRVATHQLHETLADLKKKNMELETARMDAETANQAKSDFLARMSHELRTPITSIQGFVRLLETTKLSDSDRHYCQIIDHAALHLLTLIDDILAFSKLQSKTVELSIQPINLAECTEQVVSLFAPQAQRKGLDLVIDYAPEIPLKRMGDCLRLRQILSNLVANAIKFCEEGGVYISLKTNERQDVIFEVRDTGIGIADEAQDQLFNAFSQADTSISRLYGGTGLGLSIVKSLVELMAGTIQLESAPGAGSCFQIKLPLPLDKEQTDWFIGTKQVVLSNCHQPVARAVVHALERFGITDVLIADQNNLFENIAELTAEDFVILCPATLPTHNVNIPEFILRVRAATSAKLILIATQYNLYQQFDAKQHAALHPIIFLASPPPLSELHQALNRDESSNLNKNKSPSDTNILDGVNILVAEDNQFTRLLLDTLLSKLGAYCTLTSNGEEALTACLQDQFDLFLVDVHMPKKNGIETIQTLRQSKNPNSQIPSLAVTADILQQEEKALFAAGANDLLMKPLDEEELLQKICQHLKLSLPQESIPISGTITNSESSDISAQMFRQEVQALLKAAREYLATDCIPELRENIHQLLGIAGVFKLTELENRVRQLHECVKANQLDEVVELIDQVGHEVENVDF